MYSPLLNLTYNVTYNGTTIHVPIDELPASVVSLLQNAVSITFDIFDFNLSFICV